MTVRIGGRSQVPRRTSQGTDCLAACCYWDTSHDAEGYAVRDVTRDHQQLALEEANLRDSTPAMFKDSVARDRRARH